MITISPGAVRRWPVFQIYYRSGTSWVPLKTMGKNPTEIPNSGTVLPPVGMYLNFFSRKAVPSYGEASFETPVGHINGINVNFDQVNGEITAPDLKGKEICILAAPDLDTPMQVKWWGFCDYQKDNITPSGSPNAVGKRIYQCVDYLYYVTKRSRLEFHGYINGVTKYDRCPGIPVFNGRRGRDDLKQGNKGPTSDADKEVLNTALGYTASQTHKLTRFTYDGLGDFWTDTEVVDYAIHTGQRNGHVYPVAIEDIAGSMSKWVNVHRPVEGQMAWTFIGKILKFTRGGGVSFFNFDTDSDGFPINPRVTINPIHPDDVSYSLPSSGSGDTDDGSNTAGTSITVDLTGDNRSVDTFFALGGMEDFRYDRVEVVGEKIQVMCTLAIGDNSLSKLWTDAEQADFDSAAPTGPLKQDHVYRSFGVPRDWDGVTGDGNGTGAPSGGEDDGVFFYCNDDGDILQADDLLNRGLVSPSTIRFMSDIPLHSNIDPTTGNEILGTNAGPAQRGRMVIFLRTGDDTFAPQGVQLMIKSDGFWAGTRKYDDIGLRQFQSTWQQLVTICCIELPYRVFAARGESRDIADRTKRMAIQGRHLWIGAKGSIWKFDNTGAPVRFASTTKIRDDRDVIMRLASLAEQWYTTDHRAGKWALNDFGFFDDFDAIDSDGNGVTIDFPELGQLVTKMNAASIEHTLNAPITSVTYDNRAGTTYWIADWGELEL